MSDNQTFPENQASAPSPEGNCEAACLAERYARTQLEAVLAELHAALEHGRAVGAEIRDAARVSKGGGK